MSKAITEFIESDFLFLVSISLTPIFLGVGSFRNFYKNFLDTLAEISAQGLEGRGLAATGLRFTQLVQGQIADARLQLNLLQGNLAVLSQLLLLDEIVQINFEFLRHVVLPFRLTGCAKVHTDNYT